MSTRNEVILKMYKWRGLKYGFFTGLFVAFAFSFFEPNIFGEVLKTLLLSSLGFSALFSFIGFIFLPMFKGTLMGNGWEPSNEEIMDFMDSKGGSITGGGSLSDGAGGGDGGGGDGGSGD